MLRPAVRTADGRLVAEAHITRAGIFEYQDAKTGKIRRELREPQEVFSPKSLASFSQIPVTNNHPPVGLLNSKTAKAYMVGSTGDQATRDGDHVRSSVMVADDRTIADMEAGKHEVSCGYSCDLDETPGHDPVYGRYDARQLNIVGNHLAVALHKGLARAGGTARVRMDSMEFAIRLDDELTSEQRGHMMDTSFAVPERHGLPINDRDHLMAAMGRFSQYDWQDVDEKSKAYRLILEKCKDMGVDSSGFEQRWSTRLDAAQRPGGLPVDPEKMQEMIRSLNAQLTEANSKLAVAVTRADSAEVVADQERGRSLTLETQLNEARVVAATRTDAIGSAALEQERQRADEAEAKVARFDATLENRIRARSKLEREVFSILGPTFRMDDMTERDLMASVVRRLDSTADVSAGVAEGVIAGRFMTLLSGHNRNVQSQVRVAEIIADTNKQESRTDSREANNKKIRDQWKEPLPNAALRRS